MLTGGRTLSGDAKPAADATVKFEGDLFTLIRGRFSSGSRNKKSSVSHAIYLWVVASNTNY